MLHSLLEEGDEVIVPSPNWPNMKWAVVLAGATAAMSQNLHLMDPPCHFMTRIIDLTLPVCGIKSRYSYLFSTKYDR